MQTLILKLVALRSVWVTSWVVKLAGQDGMGDLGTNIWFSLILLALVFKFATKKRNPFVKSSKSSDSNSESWYSNLNLNFSNSDSADGPFIVQAQYCKNAQRRQRSHSGIPPYAPRKKYWYEKPSRRTEWGWFSAKILFSRWSGKVPIPGISFPGFRNSQNRFSARF